MFHDGMSQLVGLTLISLSPLTFLECIFPNPAAIAQLTNLKALIIVDWSAEKGEMDVSALAAVPQLESLKLEVRHQAPLPAKGVASLTNLTDLHLSFTSEDVVDLISLSTLRKLTRLQLEHADENDSMQLHITFAFMEQLVLMYYGPVSLVCPTSGVSFQCDLMGSQHENPNFELLVSIPNENPVIEQADSLQHYPAVHSFFYKQWQLMEKRIREGAF